MLVFATESHVHQLSVGVAAKTVKINVALIGRSNVIVQIVSTEPHRGTYSPTQAEMNGLKLVLANET